tara:strand:- start:227 stop:409 length:183 start_codon:yes stop_codon:yes gene_type:complete
VPLKGGNGVGAVLAMSVTRAMTLATGGWLIEVTATRTVALCVEATEVTPSMARKVKELTK